MGGPSALVKLGELLVQQASDAYSFFGVNSSAVPGWYFLVQLSYRHNPCIPEFPILSIFFSRMIGWVYEMRRRELDISYIHGSYEVPFLVKGFSLLASAYDCIPYQHCHR